MDFLNIHISIPLEREYEGWIMHQIDRYFQRVGVDVDFFALSPKYEKKFPADEILRVGDKVVGLQFKRPDFAHTRKSHDFSQLKWKLSSPAHQLRRVLANTEIYYCLPTFINRNLRSIALHHCLFWRPRTAKKAGAWYSNPAAYKHHRELSGKPRWGLFMERLTSCTYGRLIGKNTKIKDYVEEIEKKASKFQLNIEEGPKSHKGEKLRDGDSYYETQFLVIRNLK
jgi:hypothetical protein